MSFCNLMKTKPYDEEEIADIDPRDHGLFGILPTLFEEETPPVASTSGSQPPAATFRCNRDCQSLGGL